ncbi:hypothetical protein BJ878DRAFT_485672 [Calycina marina]|uniref:Uncharacterized protein n=1 Tax=Calycina marina TaxID=1763456 RepID=A0A9P8CJ00_9HELO|nr:hypothetical protein BJ878DRAFT_485672 [Calycina marina]
MTSSFRNPFNNPILYNKTLQGSCPKGGDWYTCWNQDPAFLGCCNSDPCNGVGCPASDLRPAGLGAGAGQSECDHDSSFYPDIQCPSGGTFYYCHAYDKNASFQGCCFSNACITNHGGRCEGINLSPAAFAEDFDANKLVVPCDDPTLTKDYGYSLYTSNPHPAQETASSNSVTSSATLTATSASISASQPTSTPGASHTTTRPASESASPLVPALAGGVGGSVLILVLAVLIIYLYRRRQKKKQTPSALPFVASSTYKSKDAHTPKTPITPLAPAPPYGGSSFPRTPDDVRGFPLELEDSDVNHSMKSEGLGIVAAGCTASSNLPLELDGSNTKDAVKAEGRGVAASGGLASSNPQQPRVEHGSPADGYITDWQTYSP